MPGKALEKILGPLVPEVVEQEKRIELLRVAEAEGALEPDAGAFESVFGGEDAFDGPERHRNS
jgi:hypothetical protein